MAHRYHNLQTEILTILNGVAVYAMKLAPLYLRNLKDNKLFETPIIRVLLVP